MPTWLPACCGVAGRRTAAVQSKPLSRLSQASKQRIPRCCVGAPPAGPAAYLANLELFDIASVAIVLLALQNTLPQLHRVFRLSGTKQARRGRGGAGRGGAGGAGRAGGVGRAGPAQGPDRRVILLFGALCGGWASRPFAWRKACAGWAVAPASRHYAQASFLVRYAFGIPSSSSWYHPQAIWPGERPCGVLGCGSGWHRGELEQSNDVCAQHQAGRSSSSTARRLPCEGSHNSAAGASTWQSPRCTGRGLPYLMLGTNAVTATPAQLGTTLGRNQARRRTIHPAKMASGWY